MFSEVAIPQFALADSNERSKVAGEVVRIERVYYVRPEDPLEGNAP